MYYYVWVNFSTTYPCAGNRITASFQPKKIGKAGTECASLGVCLTREKKNVSVVFTSANQVWLVVMDGKNNRGNASFSFSMLYDNKVPCVVVVINVVLCKNTTIHP